MSELSEEDIIIIAEKIADFGWSDYDDFVKNKKAIQGLLDLYQKEKEKNKELLTRLKADALIERDKYWINKIKEALYDGILDAKGWGCEEGAYCVEKQFKYLLEERN